MRPFTWSFLRPLCAVATLALAACAPAQDWRLFVPPGSRLQATLPCRPQAQSRPVAVAGAVLDWHVVSCREAGVTWAVMWADLADPTRVPLTLDALRALARAHLDGGEAAIGPAGARGRTPLPQAVHVVLAGHPTKGDARHEELELFSHGARIYQAAAIAAAPIDARAARTFFSALQVAPA